MITELGHFALVLAFAVAIVQTIIPLVGAWKKSSGWMAVAEPAATIQFLLIAVSFSALMWAFITSDFSLRLVVLNSHSAKPMLYKISGTWGNHEGSMLLWVLIVALFGATAAWFGGNLPPSMRARVLSVQGAIGVAFLAFILFTSNPFLRLAVPPFDGQDLNPLLQDPGLAFHPPFLYLGYVGLSMAFSFAVAALIEGRVDAAWGRWVRPWTLAAWIFLTIGIALGSWWAYYELGWGGFWFWDPVENASLLPWFAMTALFHSLIVFEKRNIFYFWVIILCLITFILSVTGTFLVRSGILNSVHTFASDPSRGLYILLFLSLMIFGSIFLLFKKYKNEDYKLNQNSKETFILINNWFMMFYLITVLLGTIYPIFTDALTDHKISVGPPFYNTIILPVVIIFLLFMAIGPKTKWIKNKFKDIKIYFFILLASCGLNFLIIFFFKSYSVLSNLILISAIFLILSSLIDLTNAIKKNKFDLARIISHASFGFLVLFIGLNNIFTIEKDYNIKLGETKKFENYSIKLQNLELKNFKNYQAVIGELEIKNVNLNRTNILKPEIRIYDNPRTLTYEASIKTSISKDYYLTMSNIDRSDYYNIKFQKKPLMMWIWVSVIMIVFGGFLRIFINAKHN